MEIPYKGRAVIDDHYGSFKITIPVKRNYFVLVFFCFWMCGWFAGEMFAAREVFGSEAGGANLFIGVWLIMWTMGGLFVLKSILWQLFGKEVIEAGKGVLIISRQGDVFARSKTYELSACKSFRVQEQVAGNRFVRNNDTDLFNRENNTGTIVFDHGMKTIRFGEALDEAEGKYLLNTLKSKRVLTDNNFD